MAVVLIISNFCDVAFAARKDVRTTPLFPNGPTYGQIVESFCARAVFPNELKYSGVGVDRDKVIANRVERDGNQLWFTCYARYTGNVLGQRIGAERVTIHYNNGNVTYDIGGLKGIVNTGAILNWLKDNIDLSFKKEAQDANLTRAASIADLTKSQLKTYLESASLEELAWSLMMTDKDTLKVGLETVDKPTLVAALQSIDAGTLDLALDIIDNGTLKVGICNVKRDTLKEGLESMSKGRLKTALELMDLDTLRVALESIDKATLKAAMSVIDEPTYQAGLMVVDQPTKELMKSLRH